MGFCSEQYVLIRLKHLNPRHFIAIISCSILIFFVIGTCLYTIKFESVKKQKFFYINEFTERVRSRLEKYSNEEDFGSFISPFGHAEYDYTFSGSYNLAYNAVYDSESKLMKRAFCYLTPNASSFGHITNSSKGESKLCDLINYTKYSDIMRAIRQVNGIFMVVLDPLQRFQRTYVEKCLTDGNTCFSCPANDIYCILTELKTYFRKFPNLEEAKFNSYDEYDFAVGVAPQTWYGALSKVHNITTFLKFGCSRVDHAQMIINLTEQLESMNVPYQKAMYIQHELLVINIHADNNSTLPIEDFLFHQQNLYDNLILKVNPKIAPLNTKINICATEERSKTDIQLQFLKIIEIEELRETLEVVVEYILYYEDPRLKWNPSDYGGIQEIFPNADLVFVPDLFPSTISKAEDFRTIKYARLRNNGSMEYYAALYITAICNLDATDFPFDKQECSILFQSHALGYLQNITASIADPFPIPSEHIGNAEWKVYNLTSTVHILDPATTDELHLVYFNISLQRHSIFYISLIVVPSLILNIFSVAAIFLPKVDTLERITIGLTNIMSLSFIFGILSGMIPKARNLPLLGIYVTINLFIIVISICVGSVLDCLPLLTVNFLAKSEHKLLKFLNNLNRFQVASSIAQIFNISNIVYFLVT